MATNSNSKVNTIITNVEFNTAFKAIKNEAATLNATCKNIATLATIDKNVKVIADWLGINSANVSGKKLSELRATLMNEVVFYTTSADVKVQPVQLVKVATIDNVNYYQPRECSWLTALKMICNRRNKSLDTKHVNLEGGKFYTATECVVTDEVTIAKIQQQINSKNELAKVRVERRKIATSGDAAKIYELAKVVEEEQQIAKK